jgi:hypothetical protein
MPNMKTIYLRMCIRYDLDDNNIRIPLMINKLPQCTLSQLSALFLSKYDSLCRRKCYRQQWMQVVGQNEYSVYV